MHQSIIATVWASMGLLFSAATFAAENEVLLNQSERNQVQAVVQSVDLVHRDLSIKLPDGEVIEFKGVDHRVTHFENVKVDDKINVAGSESMSISLSKGTAGVRRVVNSEGKDVTADGVGVLKTRATFNDIIAIDSDTKRVKVKSPEGKITEIVVPNEALLAKAAVGDQVIVYRRATITVWGNYSY